MRRAFAAVGLAVILAFPAVAHTIDVHCWIVAEDDGGTPHTPSSISNCVEELNGIFSQVAMSFAVKSLLQTNSTHLTHIVLTDFWRNDDRWRGDDAFEANVSANSFNTTVDGRNDLINFLPIAVDVATLASHWGTDSVRYRMEADDWSLRKAQLTLADIGWSDIGDTPLGESSDIDGTAIHEAPVFALGEGADLPPAFVSLAQSRRSSLLMEFPEKVRDASLRLNAYSRGTDALLFSARLPLHVGDVAQMIG